MIRSIHAILLCLVFITACSKEPTTEDTTSSITIYRNGTIYTGLENAPKAEAVAVSDGVILAVGSADLVTEAAGANPTIIDLEGAAMYPGFTDSHAHLLGIGMRELTLNLEGIGSLAEIVSTLEEAVSDAEPGALVYGRGWIETGWPEGRMPTRDDLDPISPDNPVIIVRADGHALVANTVALNRAGITDASEDPDGGRIERDADGRATGILIDTAMAPMAALVGEPTAQQKREAYAKGSDVYAAYGWTGIHNMSVNPDDLDIMTLLSASGGLDIRVYNSLDPEGLAVLAQAGHQASDNGRIITRAVKLYIDGALGSRGAALIEPYTDQPDTNGLMMMGRDDALTMFNEAIAAGIQINTHAIGDRGNTTLLDWYEEAFAANPDATTPKGSDLRWRIEHAQILQLSDIPRFAELGVIPSMQPSHAIGDLYFAPDRLGEDRLDGAYAWRALIDAGAMIAGGTDAPVERGDPLIEFYAAVERRGLDGTQTEDWRAEQAVTREEALKMFTLWPAYASFQENLLGTIEPGKRADFTVFSKDIMTIPAAEILTAKPVMTVVDGEVIFKAE